MFLIYREDFVFFVFCCANFPKRLRDTHKTSGRDQDEAVLGQVRANRTWGKGWGMAPYGTQQTSGDTEIFCFFFGWKSGKDTQFEMLKISEAVKQLRSLLQWPHLFANKPISRMELLIPVSIIKIYQVVCLPSSLACYENTIPHMNTKHLEEMEFQGKIRLSSWSDGR